MSLMVGAFGWMVFDFYAEPMYMAYLESQGQTYGPLDGLLIRFCLLLFISLSTWLMIRRIRSEGSPK